VVENNNLVFKTFDEAKRYLITNPGGSIVRLDSNDGFYIKLPNNTAIKPQPNKKIDIASQVHKSIDIKTKLPDYKKKKDVNNLLYSKNELKNLVKDSIKNNQQEKNESGAELNSQQEKNQKKIKELKAKIKKDTPKYNKGPSRASFPFKKSTKKQVEPEADYKRYIDEPLGTREDFKKMKGRQGFKNKTGNH
tara:strand:- start:8 stop:583 length:576 start_codon:yes stop_codon:yes gene_type:complete